MKVKEIPISIYRTLKLSFLSAADLNKKGNKNEIPVIVSLTSIESRLKTLQITIRSLLNQEVHPTKIVLWLNNSLRDKLPNSLKKLEGEIFEICYSDLNCSHRKLIHSLTKYPNDIIITCDDDYIYQKDWLQNLYEAHLANSKNIIANQTRYISFNEEGVLLPYKQWEHNKIRKSETDDFYNDNLVSPIGAGGVLYPVGSLSNLVTDQELFFKLAPKADDLWFKAMGILNNTKSILSNKAARPIPILGTQMQSLKKQNVDGDKNRRQMQNLIDYFNFDFKKK